MRRASKPLEANKKCKVASCTPVVEGAQGEPVWEVMAKYLREQKIIVPRRINVPRLIGVADDPGIA